jgi:hypothetical protein
MNQDIQKAEQAMWFVISDLNQAVRNTLIDTVPAVANKAKELHNKAIAFRDEIRVIMDDMGLSYG